jgi:hypothetical protein
MPCSAGQPYPGTINTVLYASFIVNFSALPSPSGEYFAHFKDASTSNFRAKIFALTSEAAAGKLHLGIANAANSASATNLGDLDLNTDYLVVIRYAIRNVAALFG